jgi:hypothetical protein
VSLIADALLPQTVVGLAALNGLIEPRPLAEVIMGRAGYVTGFNNGNQSITMDFRYTDPVAVAIAGDCNRLTSSSIQSVSIAEADIEEKDLFPWALVKLYYSAFYAGNAISRLLGTGCVYVSSNHVRRWIANGNALGQAPGFPINSGLYRCTVNPAATELTFSCLAGSGTHEVFWSEFVRVLNSALPRILNGPQAQADAQSSFAKLTTLSQMFTRNGGHAWLSRTRNNVQYHHAYQAWFRCGVLKHDRDALARVARQWSGDPMRIDLDGFRGGELGEFVTACAFLVSTCHVLLLRLSSGRRPRSARSFLSYGPVALLNSLPSR